MKTYAIALTFLLVVSTILISSCAKEKVEIPCNGKGTLNVENKLDSVIFVKVVQTHDTKPIEKDYTRPFSLTGDQPYTFTIDGPNYHIDTTIFINSCDNKLFIVTK
jgi:hypothetical protein